MTPLFASESAYDGVFISDGLPFAQARDRYQARRDWLLDQLDHPLLLIGPTHGPSGTYPWAHIHRAVFQDPYLLYLTGINQTGVALWLDPRDREIVLFLPKKNPKLEFWEGLQLGSGSAEALAEASTITGIPAVLPRTLIGNWVKTRLSDRPLGLIWNTTKGRRRIDQTWQDISPIYKTLKRILPRLIIVNDAPTMWSQRLVMDAIDIDNLRIANTLSADAYLALLHRLSTCTNEHTAWAILDHEIAIRSLFGTSFPSIVAGGKNAAILHYTKNNEPLSPMSLLLTDFGVRWHAMHADVTRTAPVSGLYSPLQRLIIEIVLMAQQEVQAHAKPGVSIKDINDHCWAFINQKLEQKVTQKGGAVRLPYSVTPHNVSHLLGHQVHDGDPSREYRTRPLQAGNIISNEPGIYGEIELIIDGTRYKETLGIRIEDDLLITETGCENLTPCIKDPNAIAHEIRQGPPK